jgi:hypothetical protein
MSARVFSASVGAVQGVADVRQDVVAGGNVVDQSQGNLALHVG